MKHTPGPWHTGNIGRKGIGWCTIFNDTTPIARALSLHKKGERKSGDFDIEAANARLIAAAPELLEALRELVAEFEELNRELAAKENYSYYPESGGIAYARTVIAKAEGTNG